MDGGREGNLSKGRCAVHVVCFQEMSTSANEEYSCLEFQEGRYLYRWVICKGAFSTIYSYFIMGRGFEWDIRPRQPPVRDTTARSDFPTMTERGPL